MKTTMTMPASGDLSAATLSHESFAELLRLALLAGAAAGLRLAHTVLEWHARARGRRHLAALGERELRDLGLSRADAWQEVTKPFWRV